jgi:hemerythrin superfamily protein
MAGSAKSLATSPGARMVGIAMAGVALGLLANLGRKAMVQAPTALSGDWLEGVKAEHRLALALFDQIEQTADHAAGRRAALLLQLKHALGKHAFTEENVIYPALRQWRDQEDADRLTHDHGYVKQYLFELEAMPKDDPGFLAKVATFRSKLEEHIRDEETVIFPPLHDVLGPDGNARITALANKEGFKLA